MRKEIGKAIFEAVFAVLFFAACAAIMLYSFREDMDRDIAIECSLCSSPFSWCPGYWEENGLCRRTETDTDGQGLAKREVE